MSDLYAIEVETITGETISLAEFKDQALLIVNLASQWGMTPQYAGLRTLHEENDDLQVLGFPCNQFGAQEPGSNAEILDFARSKYNVSFPMFSKTDVNGDDESPLFSLLKREQPGDIGWNFTKFLVNRDGKVVARFDPRTSPEEIAGKLDSVNYDWKNRKRRQEIPKQYIENGSFYLFRPEVLRENNNRFGGEVGVVEMEFWKMFEIDSMDDLRMCSALMKEFLLEK